MNDNSKIISKKPFPQSVLSAASIVLISLIVLGLSLFLVWNYHFRQSETELALTYLNNAYKLERPLESRITNFDYAPVKNTRGDSQNNPDKIELDRAEKLLLDTAADNPTAENLHSLSRVYLAKKEFDEARKQLEKAAKLAPENAQILCDLGTAWAETGRRTTADEERGKRLKALATSLDKYDAALKLNRQLAEASFNRALSLELLNLPSQTQAAWRKYLELDKNSSWIEEAKRHLQILESQKTRELSSDELKTAFLNAFRQKNDEEAWWLLSQTRELITGKYLPQKLAISLVENGANEEILDALKYLGELEKTRNGDFFAAELAEFYATAPTAKFELLKKAQTAMQNGYKLCEEGKFSQAAGQFITARTLFLQAEDFIEANTISQYFIAYCLYVTDQRGKAVELFRQIDEFTKTKNYKWLNLMNFYWLTGAREFLAEISKTEVKNEYEKSLAQAQKMEDSYLTQQFLLNLASRSDSVSQESEKLSHLQKLFEISNTPKASLRQKVRNFGYGLEMLLDTHLDAFSQAVAVETVELTEQTNDNLFPIYAQINAGVVHTQTGNFDEARKWLLTAKQNAETVSEESERKNLSAKSLLKLGHLERKIGNFQQAAADYDESDKILETTATPIFLYELQKSRLLTYQALGEDAEVEKQIPAVLNLAEKYRTQILEEQERNTFFNNEQTIYDIAVEHEFRQGRDDKAFDYAEISNSRSLLDWLKKGANIVRNQKKTEVLFDSSTKPYSLDEIRAEMPPNVQILQYTVLEKRVLIWAISKENVAVAPVEIESDILREKVESYLKLLQSSDTDKQLEAQNLSAELYNFLVNPILPYLDRTKEICLVPSKVLFYLPFAALVSPNKTPFLQEFTIFYAPSASVFIICTENAGNRSNFSDETLLSVGNPTFDREAFPDLPALPAAESEARDIGKFYENSTILLAEGATKEKFQASFKNADVVHFAGHYLVENSSPLDSSLLLAKAAKNDESGVLTNAELVGEKLLRTKLVVLSACQTGVESYYKGEGLIGLSRSFLASGAPLVVASQWQVDSDA
ncbi:MAG: CHAT domain-containing protein, partial [Acidobacteria bacterium]|nr:CHAT domain-containing protein [Acidobacteriota bacterium]